MDNFKLAAMEKRINKTISALKKNNMDAFYAKTSQDAINIIENYLTDGMTISNGGSVTLKENGIINILDSGKYNYIKAERAKNGGLTREESADIARKAFFADVYFTSSNAITEDGLLYNVDGFANRVAALIFGPKTVFVVAGYNKIVHDLNDAVKRVKSICAPANTQRLDLETYCNKTGECSSFSKSQPGMCDGCESPDRICCTYTVLAKQRIPGRIKVIIIGESLGY